MVSCRFSLKPIQSPKFWGVKSMLIHDIPDDVRKFSQPALRISSSTRCVSLLPRVFLRIHTLSHLQSWSTSGPMVPTHGSMMHHDAMAIDPDFLTLKISAMVFPMQSQFPFGSSTSNLHRCWTRPGVDGTGKSDEQKKIIRSQPDFSIIPGILYGISNGICLSYGHSEFSMDFPISINR